MSLRTRDVWRLSLAVAAAGVLVLGTVGQAHADSGGGNFGSNDTGYEVPSERVTLAVGRQCGWFHNTNHGQPDLTTHHLPMDGEFGADNNVGTGLAVFTIPNDWFANEDRTHFDFQCDNTTAEVIPGTITIEFDGDDSDWSCSGEAGYSREGTTYTLVADVTCNSTPIDVTFSGTQLRCGTGFDPCNDPDAGSNLIGTYSWND